MRLSRWRSVALCLVIYAAVLAMAWSGGRASGYALAPIAVLLIAALQNHLLILQHEAAHRMLHPNRRVNELVGDLLCSVPFFGLLRNYRYFHLEHHRFVGSPGRDPEVRVNAVAGYAYARLPASGLLRMLAADALGLNYLRFVRELGAVVAEGRAAGRVAPPGVRDLGVFVLFWGPVVGFAVAYGFVTDVLIFWILPQPTLLFLLLKLHAYGEHTGATGPTAFERTWVHVFHPVVDFFIYPIRSGFHLEHHLFPRVPWYRMRRLRRALMADPSYARQSEPVTAYGYFFGRRTILGSMLLGRGEYREVVSASAADEQPAVAATPEAAAELDAQELAGVRTPR